MDRVDELAKVVWGYMQLHQPVQRADIILTFGTNDLRLADHAAQLYNDGYAPLLMFSGGFGKIKVFDDSEARTFAKRAIKKGVPEENILLEEKASNTGENVILSSRLLQEKRLHPKTVIVVHKPYMERRTLATLHKQWPMPHPEFFVTSPNLTYEEYFNSEENKNLWLNVMVGDMQRMKTYVDLGFQEKVDIPHEVWSAYEALVEMGYDKFVTK